MQKLAGLCVAVAWVLCSTFNRSCVTLTCPCAAACLWPPKSGHVVGHRQCPACCSAVLHPVLACRSGTWSVCWSPSNEYQLFSGDGSGAVRLWDIRQAGCRALLDFNTTQRPKPITAPASTPCSPQQAGRKRARTGVQGGEAGFGGGRGKATGAAVAHEGAVTGVLATPDGLSLVSAGTDHRVRLWDAGECGWQRGDAARRWC